MSDAGLAGDPGDPSSLTQPEIRGPSALNLVGPNSCAAASCHGGGRLLEGRSFAAYQIWSRKDPHSQAYEVLDNDLSQRIMGLLYPLEHGAPRRATKEARCLNCHGDSEAVDGSPRLSATVGAKDGVSCESCHGPAKQWLGIHSTADWHRMPDAEKIALGFIDTSADLQGRVQLCASCHVGGKGRDVNHDLIAAGHPRLDFEFSAFHANLPKHWEPGGLRHAATDDIELDSAFEARAWLTGQLVTAQTSLRLLEDRTSDERPWPELAEYACFNCHHDLQHDSWYQSRRRSSGRLAWGTWNFGSFPALTREVGAKDEFESLRQLMEDSFPEREAVRVQVSRLDQALDTAISQTSSFDFSVNGLDQLALHLIAHSKVPDNKMPKLPAPSWDETAQLYLATVAICLAREKLVVNDPRNASIANDLEAIRQKLLFGNKAGSPQDTSGREMDEILARLKGIEETLTKSDAAPR